MEEKFVHACVGVWKLKIQTSCRVPGDEQVGVQEAGLSSENKMNINDKQRRSYQSKKKKELREWLCPLTFVFRNTKFRKTVPKCPKLLDVLKHQSTVFPLHFLIPWEVAKIKGLWLVSLEMRAGHGHVHVLRAELTKWHSRLQISKQTCQYFTSHSFFSTPVSWIWELEYIV